MPRPRSKYVAPREYSQSALNKSLNQVYRDINDVLGITDDLYSRLGRVELSSLTRESLEGVGNPVIYVDWSQVDVSGTPYGEARVVISKVGSAPYFEPEGRYKIDDNIPDDEEWTSFKSSWVNDATYPRGGYFRYRIEIPTHTYEEGLLHMQVRVRTGSDTWITESFIFDADREPHVRSLKVQVGTFNAGTGKWRIMASAVCDEDTASHAFGLASTAYDPDDSALGDSDFDAATVNSRISELQLVGELSPSVISGPTINSAYVICRAYSETDKGGIGGTIIARDDEEIPFDPRDPSLINDDSILAGQLADNAKRVNINVAVSHTSGFEATSLDYSGSLVYADGTSYSLTPGSIDLSSSAALWYIYFDPSASATALQATTTAATAKAFSGRRVFIGVAQKADATSFDRAFYVMTGDAPVITAPYINAVSLSAISANLGTITTGTIQATATVEWGAVEGTTGAPEAGATAGADWTSNLTNIPVRFAEDDSPAVAGLYASPSYMGYYSTDDSEWKTYMDIVGNFHLEGPGAQGLTWNATTGVLTIQGVITLVAGSDVDYNYISGSTKPADNATVGATWGTDLLTIPDRFTESATDGLNLTATHLGYYHAASTTWKTYMDASGQFFLSGSGSNSLTWDGTNLSINGGGVFSGALSAATGDFAGKITAGDVSIGIDVSGSYDGISLDGANYWLVGSSGYAVFSVGDGTNNLTYNSATGDLVFIGEGTIKNANGDPIIDPTGDGVIDNADLTNLGIAGTLTLGVSGEITNAAGTVTLDASGLTTVAGDYAMALSGSELSIDRSAVWNTTVNETGVSVSDLVESSQTTIGSGSITLSNGSAASYGFAGSGYAALTRDGLSATGNSIAISTTTSGDVSLSPAGSLLLNGLAFPSSDGTSGQALVTNGSGTLSWDTIGGSGTVTSVSGAGTVSGLTLTGTVTSSGSITLGGAISLPIGQVTGFTDNSANWNTAYGWGNHAAAGYLTSVSEGAVTAHQAALSIAGSQLVISGSADTLLYADSGGAVQASTIDLTDVGFHLVSNANPHSVTKAQVGLGNVENTALSTWAGSSSITTIAQSAVTAHQAALAIGSAQVTMASPASDNIIATDETGVLYVTAVDAGDIVLKSAGASITFMDTEFQVDSGETQYRQRTVTVTNGQIVSVGSFGSWLDFVHAP